MPAAPLRTDVIEEAGPSTAAVDTRADTTPPGFVVVWNGEMDRRGTCPALVNGAVRRPSTLNPTSGEWL